MESDDWVPVYGFPGYSINPLGQVARDSTGRLLHTRLNQDGVPYVGLMREWQQCIRSLPLLVARAFLDRPSDIFDTVRAINEGERFPNSLAAACRYGLLEREVVLSIVNRTYAWPTYQYFELVEMR
jgi:hypothetical protein